MPRKLLISREIFFTLKEFNNYYFHFLKMIIIEMTINIENISACQKEIGINSYRQFIFSCNLYILFNIDLSLNSSCNASRGVL